MNPARIFMKTKFLTPAASLVRLALLLAIACAARAASGNALPNATNAAIAWADLGAKATAQYSGAGLTIAATPSGAVQLRCAFQKLEGEVTAEGLWLNSTAAGGESRFRVVADALGRAGGAVTALPRSGAVSGDAATARFVRPGLVEEYSVSVDGVRQDFVVAAPPAGTGDLRVELALTGARAEPAATGAQLVLDGSGRKLAYSRLRVTDATGRELAAKLVVPSPARLAVLVADAGAVYPVRVDPTFSDANWVSMGVLPGANGTVSATAVDGSGNLYVGGTFTVVGMTVANNIAKWNGTAWSALGSGIAGPVYALAVAESESGTTLYAGGAFTTAGGTAASRIASWSDSTWSALGMGMDDAVRALAVASDGTLYAGGQFTQAGEYFANSIAMWNGNAWQSLGNGVMDSEEQCTDVCDDPEYPDCYQVCETVDVPGTVYALAVAASGTLYAGGQFTKAGVVPANYIAKWDDSAWSALGPDMMDGQVNALAVAPNGTLYAGGWFTTAGGGSANYIAKWSGSPAAWSALGSGMDTAVSVLAVASDGTLYAGGNFATAGEAAANYIAKWNGSIWSALGSGAGNGVNSGVSALAVASDGTLYAGGDFTTGGGTAASRIASWSDSTWSALGLDKGVNGVVNAVAVSGTTLYAGGGFSTAGGTAANNIAQWDGSAWSALDSGMDGKVDALAVASDGTLYAGGDFTTAGGTAANYIAKWSGSPAAWSALGSGAGNGVNSGVSALAVATDGTLYAGGHFTTAGGVSANHIAKWSGSAWSALGSGVNDRATALAVATNGTLYAGGWFTTAGGGSANFIAKWSGSPAAWSALGSGMDTAVSVLAVASDGTLYAGGGFTFAINVEPPLVTANRIAKWSGSAWSALGSGVGGSVNALAVAPDGTLYAGGDFTTAGGTGANRIAMWTGSAWSALGSGMDTAVSVLAVASDGTLYAGGSFATAGGQVSTYLAQLSPAPTTTTLGSSANPATSGASITLTATVSPGAASGAVAFKEGATTLSTGTLSGGVATFSSSALAAGSHVIRAEYPGDANYLGSTNSITQVITPAAGNHAPTAGAHYLGATINTPLRVNATVLSSLDADVDGDALSVSSVTSPSLHGTVVLSLDTITYTPATDYVGTDQFTYTISDGALTTPCTATVTVRLGQATSAFTAISGNSGTVTLRGYGIPGHAYDIQYSATSNFATIAGTLGPVTAVANGMLTYTDATAGAGPRFYRFAVHAP